MEIKTTARRLVHTTRRLQVYVCLIGSGNPKRLLQFQRSHCNSRQVSTLSKLRAPAVQPKKRQRPGQRGRRHMVGATLSSEAFCAAAQQLAAAWQQFLPDAPQWHWVPSQRPFATSSGGGCLALQRELPCGCERRASLASDAQQPPARSSSSSSEDETQQEEEDPACALPAANSAAATLVCHIAYHTSYRVPVLHFEVIPASGAPLSLAETLAALPLLRQAAAGSSPDTVVTQEASSSRRGLAACAAVRCLPGVHDGVEHPLLGRPMLMLHPCQTEAVMKLLVEGEDEEAQPAGCGSAAPASRAAPSAGQRPLLRYLLAWLSVAGQPLGLSPPAALWVHAAANHVGHSATAGPAYDHTVSHTAAVVQDSCCAHRSANG
ncbi:Ubiquitin-like-conjugating enzyme [Chlorella vulgaris]